MSYRHVRYRSLYETGKITTVFRKADDLLSDAYSMFYLPLDAPRRGGGGNLRIALIL